MFSIVIILFIFALVGYIKACKNKDIIVMGTCTKLRRVEHGWVQKDNGQWERDTSTYATYVYYVDGVQYITEINDTIITPKVGKQYKLYVSPDNYYYARRHSSKGSSLRLMIVLLPLVLVFLDLIFKIASTVLHLYMG